MSLVQEQWEFIKDIAKLITFIEESGFLASGGELWRSLDTQGIYVMQGKSKTMNSKHLERLAIDLNFFDSSFKFIKCPKVIGDYWCSLNEKNVWGGNWENFLDYGHFERIH